MSGGRIAAVDYGDARTGVAVSDLTRTLAGETAVFHEKQAAKLLETLSSWLAARQVSTIVLGLPVNMDGSAGPRSIRTRRFGERLEALTGLPVVYVDERRTTVDAYRILSDAGVYGQKRKKTVDAVAAALILETYLRRTDP